MKSIVGGLVRLALLAVLTLSVVLTWPGQASRSGVPLGAAASPTALAPTPTMAAPPGAAAPPTAPAPTPTPEGRPPKIPFPHTAATPWTRPTCRSEQAAGKVAGPEGGCRIEGITGPTKGAPLPDTVNGFFVDQNAYASRWHDRYIGVYAGCVGTTVTTPSNPPSGPCDYAAVVLTSAADDTGTDFRIEGVFQVPNGDKQWVKVVGVAGDIVTLERENGSRLTFNLSTHAFAS